MKKFNLKSNRFIVKFKNDYYVANKKVAEYIGILNNFKDEEELNNFYYSQNLKNKIYLNRILKKLSNPKFYKRNVSLPGPLKVQWKITNKCNLRCKHCYLGELDQNVLSNAQLLNISKKIIDSGVMDVTITGGEALLVDCLDEIVKNFIKNEISVKIFTNAILLKDFLNKFKNGESHKKNLSFCVSLDGTEDVHNKIRGDNVYAKAIESVKFALNLGYSVIVNCVVSKLNIFCIVDLVKELCHTGVKNIQLSNIIIKGNATNSMKPTIEEMKNLRISLQNISKSYNINLCYGELDENFENIFFDTNGNMMGKEDWGCCAGMTRVTIDYKGDVYCCPFCTDYKLGNINQTDMETIWNNENRLKFLKYLANHKNKNGRMCIMTQEGEK